MVPDSIERVLLNLKNHLENLPARLPIGGVSKQGGSSHPSGKDQYMFQGDRASGISAQS